MLNSALDDAVQAHPADGVGGTVAYVEVAVEPHNNARWIRQLRLGRLLEGLHRDPLRINLYILTALMFKLFGTN